MSIGRISYYIQQKKREKEPMSGKPFQPTAVDQHIGQRVQLRRIMMGLSQKDLAKICGVTFQQIQKYEAAGNRISASRLFELSTALDTPISFFFQGLPGYLPEPNRSGRITQRISEQQANDPLAKNETLQLIALYWKLPSDEQRKSIMNTLRNMHGGEE